MRKNHRTAFTHIFMFIGLLWSSRHGDATAFVVTPQNQRQVQSLAKIIQSSGLPLSSSSSTSNDQLKLEEERTHNARELMTVNKDNWKEVVNLWTDDATYMEPSFTIQGKEQLTTFLRKLFASNFVQDDYQFLIEDEVYDGNKNTYMCYWRMYGTFKKSVGIWDLKYTLTETFDAKGCSIMKFRPNETRCYFHHDLYTEGDLWKNIIFIGSVVEYLRYLFRQSVTTNQN